MEEEKLVGQLADDVVQIRREVGILVHDAGKRLLEGIDVDLFVRVTFTPSASALT